MADTVGPRFLRDLLSRIFPSTTEAELARRDAILSGGRLGPSTDVFTDLERLEPGPGSSLVPNLLSQPAAGGQRVLDIGILEAENQEEIKRQQERAARSRERTIRAEQERNRTLLKLGELPENIPPVSKPFEPPVLFPGKGVLDAFLNQEDDDEDEF